MPTKTADKVVRQALEAQGGLESWQRVAFVTATVDLNGVVWEAKTRDHPLPPVRVTVETGDQRTSVTPFGQRVRRTFEGGPGTSKRPWAVEPVLGYDSTAACTEPSSV